MESAKRLDVKDYWQLLTNPSQYVEWQKERRRHITQREKERLKKSDLSLFVEAFKLNELLKEYKQEDNIVETFDDFFQVTQKIPLEKYLTENHQTDQFFSCYFFKGNGAWISKNQDGHYRYFSKRRNREVIIFDFMDLMEIYYQTQPFETIERVSVLLNLHFMKALWNRNQCEKYEKNHEFLTTSFYKFPHLSILLSKHLPVLEAMNVLGCHHIVDERQSYKKHNIFFTSNSFLAKYFNSSNKSKINQILNLLAVLGLIEKVPANHISPVFFQKSRAIADNRNLGNHISYYIVPSFESQSFQAEQRAKILLQNGVHYSNISKTMVSTLFGEEFTESIYIQTIQKNKLRKNEQRDVLLIELESHFERLLRENGYVSKGMIAEHYQEQLKDKVKRFLNQVWTVWLSKYQCDYIKPTKEMKLELNLTTNEYLAFREQGE